MEIQPKIKRPGDRGRRPSAISKKDLASRWTIDVYFCLLEGAAVSEKYEEKPVFRQDSISLCPEAGIG